MTWIALAFLLFLTVVFLSTQLKTPHSLPEPPHVAYAPTTYTASAAQDTFTIVFPYLRDAHVTIKLDGTAKDHTFSSDGLDIILDTPAAGDEAVLIERTTSQDALVTWTDGTAITQTDLADAFNQVLYLTEETDFRLINPNRLYATGSATTLADAEVDILGLTALSIPGADGVKKYRVNVFVPCWITDDAGLLQVKLQLHIGSNGTQADSKVITINKYYSTFTGVTQQIVTQINGFEITPATSDKIGVVIDVQDGFSSGTAQATAFLEVVEVRE